MLFVLLRKGSPSVLRSNLCTDLSADGGSILTVDDESDKLLRLGVGFVVVISFSIRFLMVKCGFALMYGFSSKAGWRYSVSNGKKSILVVSTIDLSVSYISAGQQSSVLSSKSPSGVILPISFEIDRTQPSESTSPNFNISSISVFICLMFGFRNANRENKSFSLIIGSILSNLALMAKKMDDVNKLAILSELQGSSSLFANHSSTSLSGLSGAKTPDMLLSFGSLMIKKAAFFPSKQSHHHHNDSSTELLNASNSGILIALSSSMSSSNDLEDFFFFFTQL